MSVLESVPVANGGVSGRDWKPSEATRPGDRSRRVLAPALGHQGRHPPPILPDGGLAWAISLGQPSLKASCGSQPGRPPRVASLLSLFLAKHSADWKVGTSFMPLQTSAQGAQKLRHDTRPRSAERSSLKCSGEETVTRLGGVEGLKMSDSCLRQYARLLSFSSELRLYRATHLLDILLLAAAMGAGRGRGRLTTARHPLICLRACERMPARSSPRAGQSFTPFWTSSPVVDLQPTPLPAQDGQEDQAQERYQQKQGGQSEAGRPKG